MNYIYLLLKKNKKGSLLERVFYVGQTTCLKDRIKNHKTTPTNNKIKHSIIKKYDYEHLVLWEIEDKNETNEREAFLIRWFGKICNNTGILANISDSDFGLKPAYSEQYIDNEIQKFEKSKLSIRKYCIINNYNESFCQTLIRWLNRKNKLHLVKTKKKISNNDITKIIELYNLKYTFTKISKELIIDRKRISKIIKSLGIYK